MQQCVVSCGRILGEMLDYQCFFFFERDLMLRWRMFRDGMVAVDIMCVFWLNYIFNAIIEKELKFVCTLLVFMMSIVMSLVSVILVLMISS